MDGSVEVPDPPLDLAATPTPVERLDVLSDEHDADLFVKRDDTTAGVAHGNKVRKLEYLLGDAVEGDADTVVTCGGVQSNHCRATAVLAPRLGLDAHLVLLGEEPEEYDGNFLVSRLAGATVEHVPASEFRGFERELSDTAENLRKRGASPCVLPLGGSNPRGALGFVRAYEEIETYADETDVDFDRIVVPLGSGGTCAGLVVGALRSGSGTEVVGVDVTPYGASYQRQNVVELVEGTLELLGGKPPDEEQLDKTLEVASGYVGPGYGEPSDADVSTAVEVGRKEGLVLDTTYSSKAFRQFLETTESGDTGLFLHTGGSYGIFPHAETITRSVRERASE